MAKFLVQFQMTANGSITVEASSVEEAKSKVENLPFSELGKEADDGEVDITETPISSDGV